MAVRVLAGDLFGTAAVGNLLQHGGRTRQYIASLVVAACVEFDEVARQVSVQPGSVGSELRVAFKVFSNRVVELLLSADKVAYRNCALSALEDARLLEAEIVVVESVESSASGGGSSSSGSWSSSSGSFSSSSSSSSPSGSSSDAEIAVESLELPPSVIDLLQANGYSTVKQVLAAESELEAIDGIGKVSHAKIVTACKKSLGIE